MARWKQDFDNHQIHGFLSEFTGTCEAIRQEEISPTAKTEIRRLLKIAGHIKNALENADPEVVSTHLLKEISNGLEQARQHLNDPLSARDEGQLSKANNVLSGDALQYLAQLRSGAKGARKESPLRGLEQFVDDEIASMQREREAWAQEVSELETQKSQLTEQLQLLSNAVAERQQQIVDALNQFQNQFSEDQNARGNQFSEDQNARGNQFSEDQNQRENAFTENQTERDNQFTAWFSDFRSEADKKLGLSFDKQQQAIKEQREKLTAEIKEILDDSTATHAKILELYGLAAGDSVGASFEKQANNEQESAKFWDKCTLGSIGATAAWGIYSYVFVTQDVTDTSQLVFNLIKAISITGVLIYGAVFCSRRAAMHHRNEARSRWFAQQMAAITPFSATLADEDQKSFIFEIGTRVFGNQDASGGNASQNVEKNTSIAQIIRQEFDSRFADLRSLLKRDSE